MEVASDKLMDLVLALCVQILKLVQVPLDIKTIWGQQIWFSLDEMFTLNSCYLAKNRNLQVNSANFTTPASYLTVVKTWARCALALSMQYRW